MMEDLLFLSFIKGSVYCFRPLLVRIIRGGCVIGDEGGGDVQVKRGIGTALPFVMSAQGNSRDVERKVDEGEEKGKQREKKRWIRMRR